MTHSGTTSEFAGMAAALATADAEGERRAGTGWADIQAQLDVLGYAQVIAVLAPAAAASVAEAAAAGAALAAAPGQRRGAAARTAKATGASAGAAAGAAVGVAPLAELERYFVVPPQSQDVALAHSRVHAAARGVRRALAAKRVPAVAGGGVGAGAQMLATASAAAAVEVPKVRVFEHLGVVLGTVDREGAAGLRDDPRIGEVEPAPPISLIRPVATTAARRAAGPTWGLRQLGIPEMWNAGLRGRGLLVGHLDTGVDAAHPALTGAVAAYAEFDFLGAQVPRAQPRDTEEHGTHTAGTIVGRAVGTTAFGVAPEARLVSATVIEGGNVIARILGGMNWAVGQGARILSLSLGLRGYTPAFLTLTRVLRARGVLPVIAVGNEGPGTSRSPGNYVEALSVGACDSRSTVADFSGSQRFTRDPEPVVPDLVGPGVDVLSCVPNGRYAAMSGSSMATPHIAGLAALLWQAVPGATADEIERAIFDSCQLAPGMLPDRANRGFPNGPRAYFLLTGTSLPGSGNGRDADGGTRPKRPGSAKRARDKDVRRTPQARKTSKGRGSRPKAKARSVGGPRSAPKKSRG